MFAGASRGAARLFAPLATWRSRYAAVCKAVHTGSIAGAASLACRASLLAPESLFLCRRSRVPGRRRAAGVTLPDPAGQHRAAGPRAAAAAKPTEASTACLSRAPVFGRISRPGEIGSCRRAIPKHDLRVELAAVLRVEDDGQHAHAGRRRRGCAAPSSQAVFTRSPRRAAAVFHSAGGALGPVPWQNVRPGQRQRRHVRLASQPREVLPQNVRLTPKIARRIAQTVTPLATPAPIPIGASGEPSHPGDWTAAKTKVRSSAAWHGKPLIRAIDR